MCFDRGEWNRRGRKKDGQREREREMDLLWGCWFIAKFSKHMQWRAPILRTMLNLCTRKENYESGSSSHQYQAAYQAYLDMSFFFFFFKWETLLTFHSIALSLYYYPLVSFSTLTWTIKLRVRWTLLTQRKLPWWINSMRLQYCYTVNILVCT